MQRQTSFQRPSCSLEQKHQQHLDASQSELVNMDKEILMNLVVEKDKRIQDLERILEEQRRLRLQDASQVEEKAAKIKEWVVNKLKELENQNKLLKDQNKKHKENVEILSNKLANMSPISSPRKSQPANLILDNVQYIDQPSPPQPVSDLKNQNHPPLLKKTFQSSSLSSEDDDPSLPNRNRNSSSYQVRFKGKLATPATITTTTIVNARQESPIYDSVTVEQINRRNHLNKDISLTHTNELSENPPPPPPPLHQSDRWELQLYNLADQTLSTLVKQQEIDKWNESSGQLDSIDSNPYTDKDTPAYRKSSSSLKNDLISLVRPSFTTIDGDQVVDDFDFDSDLDGMNKSAQLDSIDYRRNSNDQSSQSSLQFNKLRKDSSELGVASDNIGEKTLGPNLFDSPLRSRSGKENILRTQSVRRNPAPEKLYDFITSDLTKRGYLIKPGALKNHTRWYVLKNFNLYSYKCEADELSKSTPNFKSKLDFNCQVHPVNQSGDCSFPFKLIYPDKTLQLIANSAQARDEWVRMLTVTINMIDLEPDILTKNNSTYEGILNVTRHGHNKRRYATLVNHVIFFLKSLTDPIPLSYLSVRGAKIREITNSSDYDVEEQELLKQNSTYQDCSLAIYPKYSMSQDPVYITMGSQQDTDKWFYYLSVASGMDQSYGTQFERTLTKIMINNSMILRKNSSTANTFAFDNISGCLWREHSVMLYSDRPITQPLTSLTNETLRLEAIELFKSILLFTQVPLEPVAIDYHVCLLQNCLARFLKYPELRNEFYAQLIKQCTYVLHRCGSQKFSSGSGSSSEYSTNLTSSPGSLSPSSSECQFITDVQQLDSITIEKDGKFENNPTLSQLNSLRDKNEQSSSLLSSSEATVVPPPSRSELLQVMQILAVAVSLNLPRGRLRWWLIDHLRKFANSETDIGKYALHTLKAIDRTVTNGNRHNVPSRTEIMSILLRNPYDHSSPHSLPVSFPDGSYLVVEADGSTTVEEFMTSMSKHVNVRHSLISDFYLFADDPSGSKDIHILEPQRKVLDIVGWWEQTFRKHNSGRYQNTKIIKLMCKKRLVLKAENDETQSEKLFLVHQVNQEIVSQRIPLSEALTLGLAAIMAQLTFGDYDKSNDLKISNRILEKISTSFLPKRSSQNESSGVDSNFETQLVNRWQHLSGRSTQDCVRVYLNCIRRLKLVE